MNHFTVGRATQGLANYIKQAHAGEQLRAVIAYDTRHCSQEFAQHAAQVLQGNGFAVYLFAQPRPTPMLSFAVRHFGAQTGIVITASHNPREYNGFKAYNSTGGQLTDAAAGEVLREMNALDYFAPMAMGQGELHTLDESFDEIYYAAAEQFLQKPADGDSLKLLYTPLHGTGLVPVTGLLKRLGYGNVDVVPSQQYQDEACTFPTVAKPNPEDKCVFEPAMEIAKTTRPDVIFATDPDADRIGVLVQNGDDYEVLSGNQTGALLVDYVLARGELPAHPGVVSTIVTGTLAERICRANGVPMAHVLTGFKYIGEVMDEWEANGTHDFLFGFEESFGYLLGDHCRDKDGVISAALVAEMALFYKRQGKSLYTALQELYAKYGPVADLLYNHEAKGAAGAAQIGAWMLHIRKHFATCLPGETVVAMEDYQAQQKRDLHSGETTAITLPKSNVVKLHLADGSWLVLRPSGTEPKIKLYICTNDAFKPGDSLAAAEQRADEILTKAMGLFQ
ncbi:MAG: phospho-sugar mutase [Oscillospiraceae bacterium]|nr:phospho-sugar mutase [Oscillospiraceae bacterium]